MWHLYRISYLFLESYLLRLLFVINCVGMNNIKLFCFEYLLKRTTDVVPLRSQYQFYKAVQRDAKSYFEVFSAVKSISILIFSLFLCPKIISLRTITAAL